MKKVFAVLYAIGSLQSVYASGLSTGNDLLQLGFHVERRINDGLSLNPAADREMLGNLNAFVLGSVLMLAHTDPRVCMPREATMQQHKAVIRSYLETNPTRLGSHATVLVRDAMLQAFPCKEKQ